MAAIVDDSTSGETFESLPGVGRQLFQRPELFEDPRVLTHYLEIMRRQHRPADRGRDARCACGKPYATCEVTLRLRGLRVTGQADATILVNQWFG